MPVSLALTASSVLLLKPVLLSIIETRFRTRFSDIPYFSAISALVNPPVTSFKISSSLSLNSLLVAKPSVTLGLSIGYTISPLSTLSINERIGSLLKSLYQKPSTPFFLLV